MGMSGGPEAAAAAIVATLQAHVNEAVTLINAAQSDGVPLPTIAGTNIYDGFQEMLGEYPAIVVTPVEGQESANAAPAWGELGHHLDVTVLCQADSKDTLNRQTLRYLWAIWRTLKVYQALDGSLSGLAGVDSPRYGRSGVYKASEKSSLMMQDAGWEVVVNIVESVF
jgi:hypothetical protein